MIFYALKGNAA